MLQDFAALPQIYDSLLSSPLQKGLTESENRFAMRQVVQKIYTAAFRIFVLANRSNKLTLRF
jgi:hypothetical protein